MCVCVCVCVCVTQAEETAQCRQRIEQLEAALQRAEWVGAEMSKGMAIAMRALDTNQVR